MSVALDRGLGTYRCDYCGASTSLLAPDTGYPPVPTGWEETHGRPSGEFTCHTCTDCRFDRIVLKLLGQSPEEA
jgi:hypothetical protein